VIDFEVGSLFRVVDDATGPLKRILEAVREVTKAVKIARQEMAGFGAAVAPGIGGAILETNKLAGAWTRAAESSVAAARVMNESAAKASASARTAAAVSVPSVAQSARGAGAAAVGRGGGFRPGIGGGGSWFGGGGMHITGPGVPLPGGSHLRVGGNAAMATGGLAGLSLYEASNMETDVHWLNYHLGRKDSPEASTESRKLIEDTMKSTGLGLADVGKSVTDVARIMRDTPGFDVVKEAPRVLRAALTEALSKGTTLDESVKSILGMTHMVQAYKPGEMEKLYQVFAYLSTANPATLGTMEKTFSYAIPILRSGADIDPKQAMLLSTVLSTSGVTSSKAGTWLREFGVRSMPGNKEHNALLKELGLLDENGKPTWFTGGKPDLVKALEIAGPRAAALPPERRLTTEMDLFGRRGGGAFAVLGGPTSLERYHQLQAGMNDPGNINRYSTILGDTMGTSKMVARTTLQEFNVLMIELGTTILPSATRALGDFKAVIQGLQGLLPGRSVEDKGRAGATAMEGALAGWGVGKFFGQPMLGALGGAFVPLAADQLNRGVDSLPGAINKGVDYLIPEFLKKMNYLQGPPKPTVTQTAFSFNVDGHVLAQTVIEKMEDIVEHATGSPNYNAQSHFARADGGIATG
jgi:TP901 family phage tail tape measure protein